MMLEKGVRKMPKVGDKEFDYTPEGVAEAEQYSADTGIPISNAMDRTVKEYAGGGKVGYDSIGKYNKGGMVADYIGDDTLSNATGLSSPEAGKKNLAIGSRNMKKGGKVKEEE